jgi:hypothetical protein
VSNQFQALASGEVVSVQGTHRVGDLTAQIHSNLDEALAEWSNEEGIAGEVLRFGAAAWQKGKVRLGLSIEFAPDDGLLEVSPPVIGGEFFYLLADGEVVHVQNTYRVSELTAKIRHQLDSVLAEWSNEEGMDGEVLRFSSQSWQKGKIRLNLTMKFFPDDVGFIPPAPSAVIPSSAAKTSRPAPPNTNTAVVVEQPVQAIAQPIMVANNPFIESTLEEEHFELGTMSPVTGQIEMNLVDSEGEQNSYVDFDLSAAIPEVNLDELVSRSNVSRPSLIDEVWNEMSQPNWPGIGRA